MSIRRRVALGMMGFLTVLIVGPLAVAAIVFDFIRPNRSNRRG